MLSRKCPLCRGPLGVNNVDVSFNSAQLPDGPQQLSVLVSDPAGNTTPILGRSVVVENSGQYLILVQRDRQEQVRGIFAYRYTFAPLGVSTYRFQAQVPAIVGYPLATSASSSTYIHLLTG